MSESSYWELLRDPRWQKKRLEIMERDGFACIRCGVNDKTLSVHHAFYEKGLKPWEYPDRSLRTLCEACHKEAQAAYECVKRMCGWLGTHETWFVTGFMFGIVMEREPEMNLEGCPEAAIEGADAYRFYRDYGGDSEARRNLSCEECEIAC